MIPFWGKHGLLQAPQEYGDSSLRSSQRAHSITSTVQEPSRKSRAAKPPVCFSHQGLWWVRRQQGTPVYGWGGRSCLPCLLQIGVTLLSGRHGRVSPWLRLSWFPQISPTHQHRGLFGSTWKPYFLKLCLWPSKKSRILCICGRPQLYLPFPQSLHHLKMLTIMILLSLRLFIKILNSEKSRTVPWKTC